uniref:Uncharacterized protein n=1 Tax=Amphimedon queenslandica TaxID=400682 RepID=A0A1X7VBB6_AMPQE
MIIQIGWLLMISLILNKKVVSKGFEREDGVIVKSIEMALKFFNVERQAYHRRSFISNYVHKALQPKNIMTMCQSVSLTAASISDTALQQKAQDILDKFVHVFTLFNPVIKFMTAVPCSQMLKLIH